MPDISYTIRVSTKAKYLRLQVTIAKGLEIVVPQGYDPAKIQKFLEEKEAWINKSLGVIETKKKFRQSQPLLPSDINLQAIAQTWQITYNSSNQTSQYVEDTQNFQLLLNTNSSDRCHQLLRHWLLNMGDCYLPQQLIKISSEINFPFKQVQIRNQKTLWGSCSQAKNISLNCKLLLLPPSLVRYVLIHELCHTKEMNHSPKFWQLVSRFEPNYQQCDRQLNDVWKILPAWL